MNLIGPSYQLESREASVQRTVNMVPVPLEPGNERSPWAFRDVPGLVQGVSEWATGLSDPLFDDVYALLFPLVAGPTPFTNSAPGGTTIVGSGSPTGNIPQAYLGDGPFPGVGYMLGANTSSLWVVVGEFPRNGEEWTFDTYVKWDDTVAASQDQGLLWLPNNTAVVLDTTTTGVGTVKGEVRLIATTVEQFASSPLSNGWRHIQVESKVVSAVRRPRIWIDGVRVHDGVAAATAIGQFATGDTFRPRAGQNGSAGFSSLPCRMSCWRFTMNNRNWDDVTFTPPSSLAEYLP